MNKQKVRIIESKARKIMVTEGKIWKKHGWKSGEDVDKSILKKELRKIGLTKNSLSYIYYHIFEDANFHSLNSALEESGIFKGTYGGSQKEFDDYSKAGGRTWEL